MSEIVCCASGCKNDEKMPIVIIIIKVFNDFLGQIATRLVFSKKAKNCCKVPKVCVFSFKQPNKDYICLIYFD